MLRIRPLAARTLMRAVFILPAAVLALAGAAYAMRVSPMVVEMTTTGSGAVARIEVQNLNQVNLPFETRITQINYDDKGNMTETPADGDFLVFPPQGLLPSGARQVVRLQWAGMADMPASRGYYLSVNQLPIALTPGQESTGAQVQVVYHMKALVTVAPPKAAPKVELVSARPVEIETKAPPAIEGAKPLSSALAPTKMPGVEIVVRNTGNRYAMMAGVVWTIDGKDSAGKPARVVKAIEDLNRDIGVGYLAPLGGVRTFQVPTGVVFASGSIKVKFGK